MFGEILLILLGVILIAGVCSIIWTLFRGSDAQRRKTLVALLLNREIAADGGNSDASRRERRSKPHSAQERRAAKHATWAEQQRHHAQNQAQSAHHHYGSSSEGGHHGGGYSDHGFHGGGFDGGHGGHH